MNIRRYFDLSEPVTFGVPRLPPPTMKVPQKAPLSPPPPSRQLTLGWQIATYCILLIAILASRFLDLYRAGVASTLQLDWGYLLFMAIASLLAFPVVYDRAQLTKGQPILVQIGLVFTAGMGWEKIVAAAIGK